MVRKAFGVDELADGVVFQEGIPAMKLLHIDLSILGPHSVSRLLSAEIVNQQRKLHPGVEVIYRDLAADPLMHLSPAHIAAFGGTRRTTALFKPTSPMAARSSTSCSKHPSS